MIDVMTDPCKLRSVEGVVQEWISQEVGVVKLDSGGVALFHIGQVIIKDLGKMQVHRKTIFVSTCHLSNFLFLI